MKLRLLLGILTAIGALPLVTQTINEETPKTSIDNISVVIPSNNENATTIGKWTIEEEYQEPSELEGYEWSSIVWG